MTERSETTQRSTDPMDAETLEALRGSIAKWEAIVAGTGKDEGCSNCPLCVKFLINAPRRERQEYTDGPLNCAGCPVAEKTGKDYCQDSPYAGYVMPEYPLPVAIEELAFLKSLLPQQEETPPHIDRAICAEGGQGG